MQLSPTPPADADAALAALSLAAAVLQHLLRLPAE